jgi:hypothetical protein
MSRLLLPYAIQCVGLLDGAVDLKNCESGEPSRRAVPVLSSSTSFYTLCSVPLFLASVIVAIEFTKLPRPPRWRCRGAPSRASPYQNPSDRPPRSASQVVVSPPSTLVVVALLHQSTEAPKTRLASYPSALIISMPEARSLSGSVREYHQRDRGACQQQGT